MTLPSRPTRRTLLSSAGRGWTALGAEFVHVPAGLSRAPAGDRHVLGIHVGPPVQADCVVGSARMRGLQRPGDIGLVPAGAEGSWEDDADCRILRLVIDPSLVTQVAEELERDAAAIELRPRFRLRDARIDAIGSAIRADLEADAPSDPLFGDLLAHALALRLIEIGHPCGPTADRSRPSGLSARRLRVLTDFIEANLDRPLRLADLAAVAGIGATRLKASFRDSMGLSVHQYVIRRRVDHARTLIVGSAMPISQIALAAGFAHQSHLASTMRRILGQTPSEIARRPPEVRPNVLGSA